MSTDAFDFLTESIFWSERDKQEEFALLSDDELKTVLADYRKHVLERPIDTVRGLGVAMSARERTQTSELDVNRSVLYFDEVILPDPIFTLSEWTKNRNLGQGQHNDAPRRDLVRAAAYMKELTPLIRLGRVRFLPTNYALEAPDQIYLIKSDDAFASRVPASLRQWFYDRAELCKIVTAEDGRRLVFRKPPDAATTSVMVSFGQRGNQYYYDYGHLAILDAETQEMEIAAKPPDDAAAMDA